MIFWDEKRYYSLDYFLKHKYGEKIYKISLNCNMGCPNRDGTVGTGGCIFCSSGGSGDFAGPDTVSVSAQIEHAVCRIQSSQTGKYAGTKYIAYFQAYTNTYAPISYLRQVFMEAIMYPFIVGLSISTRPDCLEDEVLVLLEELNRIKPVWVELGLQTSHEITAAFIRRGYPRSVFEEAVLKLSQRKIDTIVHVILGLPNETKEDMLRTIQYIGSFPVQGIKLQLLHVLKGTDLAKHIDDFHILTMDEYVDLVICSLELLPENIVIHRLTGDGPKDLLLAPLWSQRKHKVLNTIHQQMKIRETWQGRLYSQP
ncbi:TIGR01212 family radical SAM protein [Anaeromicropila populeti]|uniref:Radical SAM core domain-containing protein n=1 Tax=Anaeromicropila populeti TaxID=37658 RepID=A0A1I6K023_9FIRM|nr:TIGR01212 family radical SAM protein [Anaeromicropila populeti]SFR84468.1 hypothetical protein SAMN05661086_02131 [Anaeromicropila populeti]